MKRAILVVLLSGVIVVGCAKNKKTEAQAPVAPADTAFIAPQPTPTPVPPYTPAPDPVPAVAAAPQPQPAPVTAAQPVKKTTAAKPAAVQPKTTAKVYVVKKGDTLSEIAQEHHTTVKKILAVNSGMQADKILVGQKIKLP